MHIIRISSASASAQLFIQCHCGCVYYQSGPV